MALLKEVNTTNYLFLSCHTTVGRRRDADVRIDSLLVSNIHASIEWNGKEWQIRDLSRNGTWLNRRRLEKSQWQTLSCGDTLSFGESNSGMWCMENIDEPRALLVNQKSPSDVIALENHLLLPSEEAPRATLHWHKQSGTWEVIHLDNQHRETTISETLYHGETLTLGNKSWQVFIPPQFSPTMDRTRDIPLHMLHFFFYVSLDEENIGLTIAYDSQCWSLGIRAHFYILLHLARHQQHSREDGGWMDNDVLRRELGMDEAHINIQIYRIRRHVATAIPEVDDWEGFIQRQRGKTRLSIAKHHIHIEKSAKPPRPLLNHCDVAVSTHE